MEPTSSHTITTRGDARGALGQQTECYLALAFQGARPLAPLGRVSLRDATAVMIGRGSEQALTPRSVRLLDPRLSMRHARLVREEQSWFVEDLDSKNGTRLDGEPVTRRRRLRDGAVIELGASVLVFRHRRVRAAADGVGADAEVAAPEVVSVAPGGAFATLCPQLARDFARLAVVAASAAPILICGETGTGKELTARTIHALSARTGPAIAVNCGAIRDTLVESELFGHRRGAFSGAVEDKLGFVRAAEGGTLFLDEIAELVEPSQVALLRVLEDSAVVPVGSARAVAVDVRFVAATHQDLPARIADGRFRRDLYARLTGYRFVLPPLRDRMEDLGLLTAAILSALAGEDAGRVRFRSAVATALFRYDWPHNVRELRNALRAAHLLAGDGEIGLEHLPEELQLTMAEPTGGALVPDDAELRDELVELLAVHAGNISAVARALGRHRTQVRRWIERFGIDVAAFSG